jgi:phosphoenolpyruvate phosphomutase
LRAIIVAAGPGSRLRPFTDARPKCLLDIGGRTILQRSIRALRDNGVERIAVVRGYRAEQITYPDVTYYENPEYETTNLLRTLFCAEREMDDDLIVSYSDIVYGSDVVAGLVNSGATAPSADISLVVDVAWAERYDGRHEHPVAEAELVKVEDRSVVRIGKGVINQQQAHGEFIGLARFSKSAVESMKTAYRQAESSGPGSRFQRAASLRTAYLTDMVQELIERGHEVGTVDIRGGWIEIDTPQDLAEAQRRYAGDAADPDRSRDSP